MTATLHASRGYLAATAPLIERAVGRPLRQAEQIVDVFALTKHLEDAKNDIHQAIDAETKRAVVRALRDGRRIQLDLTRAMLAPLERLHRAGRVEAAAELVRAGCVPPRAYTDAFSDNLDLDPLTGKLRSKLNGFQVRLESDRVQLHSGGAAQQAIAAALLRVPGGRSIAAGLVSTALFNGMGDTFDDNQDLVGRWEYSAVLDGGTCDVCAPLDGETYDSWDAIQDVLPNGGPNPDCDGGDRCRCRAVPSGPSGLAAPAGPPVGGIGDVVQVTTSRLEAAVAARAAINVADRLHGLPSDLAPVPLRMRALPSYNPGQYSWSTTDNTPREIAITRSQSDTGLTTLHELGHYIDHQAIGDPGVFASASNHQLLTEWRAAIEDSAAIIKLRSWYVDPPELSLPSGDTFRPNRRELDYLLDPRELWARSYAQWAADRSRAPALVNELHALQREIYSDQWHDDDFAAIGAAIDKLLEELGWLRT